MLLRAVMLLRTADDVDQNLFGGTLRFYLRRSIPRPKTDFTKRTKIAGYEGI